MPRTYSRTDWLGIHNRAASTYISSEWSREVLLGVGRRRKAFFSQAVGSVLDVACGYGLNFPHLTNAAHIIAVDFSPVMLERARKNARHCAVPIEVLEADAEALHFPDDSFDTVVSSLSLCSFFDSLLALQEIRRVTRPAGRILLLEHGRSSWGWLARYQDRHVQEEIASGGCRWNQEPQQLVQQAGLRILSARRELLGILHTMVISPGKDLPSPLGTI